MKFAVLLCLAGCVRSNPTLSACDGGTCTNPACTPRTCADLAGGCGNFSDGCGGSISCGCPASQTCSNVRCVTSNGCVPKTCADFLGSCGTFSDDCNSTIVCGCPSGQSCSGGVCKTPNGCVPQTCAALAGSCGSFPDGCNGTISCGCPIGESCNVFGLCMGCTPTGCGNSCGMIDDGCGTTLNCGPCPTSQWTAIGSFSAEMRRVYQTPTAGVWIVDFDGNAYHTNDDSQFDTLKVQSMGGSEIFVLGGDVWLGGGDGISHKGSGDSSFTLLAGSPKNTGGLHGVAGGFFGTVANGTTGDLLRSTDGLTWSTITPSPAPMNMYAVFAASATEAFAVGAGGAIFHTTDGAHWQKQTSNFSGDLAAVWGSGSLMLAAGRTGTILRSTNQGVTWTKATSGITSDIFGIWGRSTSDIWASGAAATVLHSTDGGVTWSRETGLPLSSSTLVLFSVFETDGGKVYVVGQQGVIWVRTP